MKSEDMWGKVVVHPRNIGAITIMICGIGLLVLLPVSQFADVLTGVIAVGLSLIAGTCFLVDEISSKKFNEMNT